MQQWVEKETTIELVGGLTVAVQIARALAYIHDLHLIHCDLKGSNILIEQTINSEDLIAKIIDFGSSRTLCYDPELEMPVGTPCWQAPEASQKKGYNLKSDIFSLAMVYYEILTHKQPYYEIEMARDITDAIEKGKRPTITRQEAQWCPQFLKIMEKCWHPKHEKRPAAREVIDMLKEIAEEVHLTFKQ